MQHRNYTTILGIDPGLRCTGWGVIYQLDSQLAYGAHGIVTTLAQHSLPQRLAALQKGLEAIIQLHRPDEAAVEETFVNADPQSALKLGVARGVCLVTPAGIGMRVAEYAPRLVKKTVTGSGRAEKGQLAAMVQMLLPKAPQVKADAADALAIAITHAQHRGFQALRA